MNKCDYVEVKIDFHGLSCASTRVAVNQDDAICKDDPGACETEALIRALVAVLSASKGEIYGYARAIAVVVEMAMRDQVGISGDAEQSLDAMRKAAIRLDEAYQRDWGWIAGT